MFAGRLAEGLDRHSLIRLPLIKLALWSVRVQRRKTMRRLRSTVACSLIALVALSTPQASIAQDKTAKNCRMEQQCHWENFKKICVWVKVCR